MTPANAPALDPEARQFLESLIAANVPAIPTLTPAQARQRMISLTVLTGAPQVERVVDRQISGPGGAFPIRAYIPEDSAGKAPIAYCHGGGWVTGSLHTHDALCRNLAVVLKRVLVAIEYRLAPEDPFPAALEDTWAAVNWLAGHAGEFGAKAGSLLMFGDSAGGGLAAAAAFRARDSGGPKIEIQVLLYPVLSYDLTSESYREFSEGFLLTKETMEWFWRHYLPKPDSASLKEAAPLSRLDVAGLPPALVVTAGFDPLRDEGRHYVSRLQTAGVPARLIEYEGQIHDFLRRPHLFSVARAAFPQIAEAIAAIIE